MPLYTSFFQVTFGSPTWRSRFQPWKGHSEEPGMCDFYEPIHPLMKDSHNLDAFGDSWTP